MLRRFSAWRHVNRGPAVSAFNPSSLPLTFWLSLGGYSAPAGAGEWASIASTGASGSKGSATQATTADAPAVGTGGLAVFDGVSDTLVGAHATNSLVSAAAWTVVVEFEVPSVAADAPIYDDKTILTDSGGASFFVTVSSAGFKAGHYDGVAYRSAVKSCSVGKRHLGIAWFDGTNINIEVDGVAGTPVAAANGVISAGLLKLGTNYTSGSFFNGTLAELMLADVVLTSAQRAELLTRFRTSNPAVTPMLMGINLSGFSDRGGFYHPDGAAEMTLAKQGVDFYIAKGINFFRFPIWWDRLQPTLNGAYAADVWADVQELIDYTLATGATVMINNHCMSQRVIDGVTRYLGDAELPYSSLSDFWTRMVAKYGANTNVWFDLINEPDSMPSNGYATPTDALVACYNLVIADLRTAGAVNRIVLEGNGYNNAQHFDSNPYYNNNGNAGPTSADAFQAGIVDPDNNWIASCHNYPDAEHGSGGNAVDATILRTRFQEVMDWAVAHDREVMCGEYSVVATDPVGEAVTQDYLTWLRDSGRVVAASWWTGRHSSWGASGLQIAWDANPEDARWAWLAPYLTAP